MYTLRPFQKQALEVLLRTTSHPEHLLCIAATGSGKSLIYEKTIQKMKWRTLLITPLIALARQQYQKLTHLGIPTRLTSGQTPPTPPPPQWGAWIMSPESLLYASKWETLKQWKPHFLVVDECHCLWEWGESFRPAFREIPKIIDKIPSIQKSLWLTATLPYQAREELRSFFATPFIEQGEFDLPGSLHISLNRVSFENRIQTLLDWTLTEPSPAMIFVPTRASTEKIARVLRATGRRVVTYHGGMSSEERKNTEALIQNQAPQLIVSTSAFGMGMDYGHLNRVILWQIPTSILSLVQIMGRVGRGNNSQGRALCLWDSDDFKMMEWSIRGLQKRRIEVQELFHFYSTAQCRRSALKEYFQPNNSPFRCNQCDWCDQTSIFLQ